MQKRASLGALGGANVQKLSPSKRGSKFAETVTVAEIIGPPVGVSGRAAAGPAGGANVQKLSVLQARQQMCRNGDRR